MATCAARAQTPPPGQPTEAADTDATGAADDAARLRTLEANQRRMQAGIDRLEAKLDQLMLRSAEFSPFVIQVQRSDGTPLAGYEVLLSSKPGAGRSARATGTSDTDGVAIDRSMPYGQYVLRISHPTGWVARLDDLVVEVGKPLKLAIVAPDPAHRGSLLLRSQLRDAAFADLPFGEIRSPAGSGYLVAYSAEPGDDSSDSFPRLGSGIRRAGATVAIRATQSLEQPSGDTLQWDWRYRRTDAGRDQSLLLLPGSIQAMHTIDSRSARPADGTEYFADLGDDRSVGYLVAETEPLGETLRIDVPAGDVHVDVAGLLGQADSRLQDSLETEPQEGQSIWLTVNLQNDSQWIARIFDQRAWDRVESIAAILTHRTVVDRGERAEVVLASP